MNLPKLGGMMMATTANRKTVWQLVLDLAIEIGISWIETVSVLVGAKTCPECGKGVLVSASCTTEGIGAGMLTQPYVCTRCGHNE